MLQMTAINARYLNIEHSRCASVAYDANDRPVMCGAIPFGDVKDTLYERVCIPFLWEPVSENPNQIEVVVSVQTFVPSGTGSFELDCAWAELKEYPRIPASAARTASSVATLTTNNAKSVETFTLDISSRVETGPLIIWLTGKSTETSTAATEGTAGDLKEFNGRIVELKSATVTDAFRPAETMYFYESAGKEGDNLPSRTQVIRREQSAGDTSTQDLVYVWPPISNSLRYNTLTITAGDLPAFKELTSVKLYGLSIRDVPPELDEYGTKLDAGKGPGFGAAQYIYQATTTPWLERTVVHSIGSTPNIGDTDDYTGSEPINNTFANLGLPTSWGTICGCYMQQRGVFRRSDTASTSQNSNGLQVRALVAMTVEPLLVQEAGIVSERRWDGGNIPSKLYWDVDFRVRVSPDSGADTTSDTQTITFTSPLAQQSYPSLGAGVSGATLLDLKRGVEDAGSGWRGTSALAHAHTLCGAMPESAWGMTTVKLVDIQMNFDVAATQNTVILQCQRASASALPANRAKIYVFAWLVTDQVYSSESDVVGIP